MKLQNTKKLAAILIVLQCLIQGCYVAPRPVYTLEPVDEEIEWNAGRQLVTQQQAGLEIQLAFDEADRDIVFDLMMLNNSGEKVHVNPALFYYQQSAYGDSLVQTAGRHYALNPQTEMISVRKKDAENDAEYASAQQTNLLISTLDVIGDIASIGDEKSDEEIAVEVAEDIYLEQDRIDNEVTYHATRNNIENAKIFWEEASLRRTDLHDREYIEGKVVFPLRGGGRFVHVFIAVEDRLFEVVYHMRRH